MAIIKTVPPDQAQGWVKECYSIFDELGWVPRPFQIFSSNEYLLRQRGQQIMRNRDHATLRPGLLALIRVIISEEKGLNYCVSFNSKLLKMMGIADDDQLAKVMADPTQAPLDDKDKALLLFVLKAVTTPDQTSQADIQNLRDLGWEDADIVEATVHGADMVSLDILFKAFKMDEE